MDYCFLLVYYAYVAASFGNRAYHWLGTHQWLDRLASKPQTSSCTSCLLSIGIISMWYHTRLTWVLGIKLGCSSFWGKHLTGWIISLMFFSLKTKMKEEGLLGTGRKVYCVLLSTWHKLELWEEGRLNWEEALTRLTCRQAYGNIFLISKWCAWAQPTGMVLPLGRCSELYTEAGYASSVESANKWPSPLASTSVLGSRCLPWVPSWQRVIRSVKWNDLPFFPKKVLFLVTLFYHSNRKQTR